MKLFEIKNTTAHTGKADRGNFLLRGLSNALIHLLSSDDTKTALDRAFKALKQVTAFDAIFLVEFKFEKENKLGLHFYYVLDELVSQNPEALPTRYFEVDLKGSVHEKNIAQLKKGKPIYIDFEEFAAYGQEANKILDASQTKNISGLPVIVDDQLWGVLTFASRVSKKEWDQDECQILELFAQTLGSFLARKKAEKALKESEQMRDMVIEGSKLGSWMWEIPSNHIRFNAYWAQMLGYDPKELKPELETFLNLVHPEDLDYLWANINEHMAGKTELFEVELRMKTKEGGWRWIFDRGRIVERSENGLPLRAYGTHIDITPKKQVELKLKESEALFRSMYENSPLGIAYTNAEGQIIQANEKYCTLLGYTHKEMIGKNFRTITHPEDAAMQKSITLKNYEEEKHAFQLEKRYIHKDGHIVWANVSTAYLHDDQGRFQFVITIVEDITEKKKKLDALIEREALLNSFFENSPLGIVIRDPKGKIVRINNRQCEMLGYTERELLELDYRDYVHPDSIKKGEALINPAIERKESVVVMETRYTRKDGTPIWANLFISIIYDEAGAFAYLVILVEDFSVRHQALQALKESEALQKATLNAMPDLKLRIKLSGEVLEYYPSREEEDFLLPTVSCIGKNLTEIYPDFISKGILHNAHLAVKKRAVRNFEYVIPLKDTLAYFEARLSAINDQEVIAMIRNISGRKKMQQSLQEKIKELDFNNKKLQKYIDSNMELENFAYIASHDLREPVRTMRTFAQLLKKRHAHKLEESAKSYIDFIVDGSNNMHQLIEDLLTYSRVNTDKHVIESIEPARLLKEVVEGLGDTIRESKVDIQFTNLPVAIKANPTKIKQVFQNLLSNAIKFRREEVKPVIKVYAQDVGAFWQFSVEDNGIGIDPEFHERIFLLFKKLHGKKEYQGTGLGLAICKKIVEQHQGKIWVESLPDEGATFRFTISKEPKE